MKTQGKDLLVSKMLLENEIVKGFSYAYDIVPDDIAVINTVEDTELKISKECKLLCIVKLIDFRFPIRIDYWIRDEILETVDYAKVIERFCSLLKCRVLMGDETINPYSFLEVDGTGEIKPYILSDKDLEMIEKSSEKEI